VLRKRFKNGQLEGLSREESKALLSRAKSCGTCSATLGRRVVREVLREPRDSGLPFPCRCMQ